MSELTPNFGLHIPEDTDTMTQFFANLGEDMGTIDENLGQGGGGNANIVECTQAEYDSFPDTKLTDGKIYMITDTKSAMDPNLIYFAECYSTTERLVGCWYNGKPLYQKTIDCGALPNNTSKAVAHGIAGLDFVVRISGSAKRSTGIQIPLPYPYISSGAKNIGVYINDTNINIVSQENVSVYTESHITLLYTKTSDTPGSGTWTPSGELAYHYSTDEQIIGTYLTQTLYQKTFVLPSTINVSYNSWSNMGVSVTNGEKVVGCFGIASDGTLSHLMAYFNSDVIMCQSARNGSPSYSVQEITIQYTKSS